jgi:O-antigen ligase
MIHMHNITTPVANSFALPSISDELKSFNTGIVLLGIYFVLEYGSVQGLYETPNNWRLPLITAVASILYAGYCLVAGEINTKNRSVRIFSAYCVFMILYTYVATIDPTARENGIKLYLMYLVNYFVMISSVKNIRQLILIIDIWLASMSYTCLHGILQGGLVWGNQWVQDENQFAVMCAIGVPFAYFLLISSELRTKKICYAICLVLYIGGIVMSASRGGLLSGSIVGFLCWQFSKNKFRSLILVIATITLVFSFAPDRFFTEVQSFTEDEQVGDPGERMYLWRLATNMFHDNKLLGVGPFNYGEYYVCYDQQAEYRDTMEGVTWRGQKWVAHSTPFTHLAETGIVGSSLILLLQFKLLINWRRTKRRFSKMKKEMSCDVIDVLNNSNIIAQIGFWVGSLFLTLNCFPFYYCVVWVSDTVHNISYTTNNGNEGHSWAFW